MAVFGTAVGNLINRTVLLYESLEGNIGFLQLDATVRETHTRSARITSNEVEDGTNVADNIVLNNEMFQLEGLISEAPLPSNDIRDIALRVQNAGFSAISNGLGAISGGVVTDAGATLKRIVALIQLENFWKNRVPFTVITGLKKYENVVVKNLSIPVTPKDGKSLRFTIDCEVIRVVQSQTIDVPENRGNHSSPDKQSIGKQTKSAANAAESAKGSILFNTFLAG